MSGLLEKRLYVMFCAIWYHLYNSNNVKAALLPWRSVTFSKVTGRNPAFLLKVTLLHGCFSCFLNCANDTKWRNASNYIGYSWWGDYWNCASKLHLPNYKEWIQKEGITTNVSKCFKTSTESTSPLTEMTYWKWLAIHWNM